MGGVGRNASTQRYAAKVSVRTQCPTRSIVKTATTNARKGLPMCMGCVATHKKKPTSEKLG